MDETDIAAALAADDEARVAAELRPYVLGLLRVIVAELEDAAARRALEARGVGPEELTLLLAIARRRRRDR